MGITKKNKGSYFGGQENVVQTFNTVTRLDCKTQKHRPSQKPNNKRLQCGSSIKPCATLFTYLRISPNTWYPDPYHILVKYHKDN